MSDNSTTGSESNDAESRPATKTANADDSTAESGELLRAEEETQSNEPQGAITSPAKVMRIGSMVKQLLEEVRSAPLDDASRDRLAEVYERSVTELADALSEDLQEELRSLALPFEDGETPSDAELRVAQAQLVGWLEGLFHGIQAALVSQQLAAREQLQQMRQLPPGHQPDQSSTAGSPPPQAGGTYL